MKPQAELEKIRKELNLSVNNLTENDWWDISQYKYLSEEFIKEYQYVLHCGYISECQILSEKFIEENKDWLNPILVSCHQVLSEEFIERNKDWLHDWYISSCQVLSEPFIERNKDWLFSINISQCQVLSEEFIERNKDWLDISEVVENGKSSINNQFYSLFLFQFSTSELHLLSYKSSTLKGAAFFVYPLHGVLVL